MSSNLAPSRRIRASILIQSSGDALWHVVTVLIPLRLAQLRVLPGTKQRMHEVCFSIICLDYCFLQAQRSGLRMDCRFHGNQLLESDLESVESYAALIELMVQVVTAPRHRAHRNANRLRPRNDPEATFSNLP